MLRLIGILTGSALAVAFLIVAFGIPQLSAPEPEPAPAGASSLATEPEPDAEAEPEPVEATSLATEPDALDATPPANETEALIEEIFAPEPKTIAVQASEPAAPPVEENWYAFWSPFRSEIAATGFINKLQATTGIDYRVVKVKTGVYEVAFAYVDDSDIQNKLARIANATGLDMTGS